MNKLMLQISSYNCLCKLSFICSIFKCVLNVNFKMIQIHMFFHKLKVTLHKKEQWFLKNSIC